MAIRFARRVRPLLVIAALGGAAVVLPSLASATPATPQQPTVAYVQQQLGELALTNSQVVEQYDQARVTVAKREKAAAIARRAAAKATAASQRASVAFAQILQAQYEGDTGGAADALFSSDSGSNYLDRLDTLNMISAHNADVVTMVTRTRNTAAAQSTKAKSLLAAATAERNALGKKQTSVEAQINKYQQLLSTLSAAQQAAFQRTANPAVSKATVASVTAHLPRGRAGAGAAAKAVAFAVAQVGLPYVYGSAGPGSYDCSGLTMASWHAAGVNLPHSAADQYNYGHHVSRANLQPGDLLFFYRPIGHVTIYIGGGYMVSAPTEGENVSVVRLSGYNSDYVGATRLT